MNRPKFSRIYFPGLISLVFLPMMCIWYLVSVGKYNTLSGIKIAWGSDEFVNDYLKSQKKSDINHVRKFDDFILTGDKSHDKLYLDDLPNRINKLAVASDTINGIRIALTAHTSYDEIVGAIDAYYQFPNDHLVFLPYQDKFFIWRIGNGNNPPLQYKHPPFICGTVYLHQAKPDVPFFSIENIKKSLTNITDFLAEFWPSVIAFILMLSFLILRKRRYLNLKTFRLVG